MPKFHRAVFAFFLATYLFVGTPLTGIADVKEITGKITSLESKKLTVQGDQQTLTIAIAEMTVRKGSELRVGQNVKVTYYVTDALIAKEIQVLSN